ncbi:MAG: hypothetical protein A4E53_02151 [Pelotomaculum sp. PtaB.Bin104]|nr:MAG: hypothetical protein A4E53_02151 [Pelotomaculum sp. PtaB.Bin104]
MINDYILEECSNKSLFGWLKDAETKTKWIDFLQNYKDYFKDYDGFLKITRNRFKELDNLIKLIYIASAEGEAVKPVHKPLIFSIFVLLSSITTRNGVFISTGEIKELLGFNKESNSIDYILKENGLLDRYGVTKRALP